MQAPPWVGSSPLLRLDRPGTARGPAFFGTRAGTIGPRPWPVNAGSPRPGPDRHASTLRQSHFSQSVVDDGRPGPVRSRTLDSGDGGRSPQPAGIGEQGTPVRIRDGPAAVTGRLTGPTPPWPLSAPRGEGRGRSDEKAWGPSPGVRRPTNALVRPRPARDGHAGSERRPFTTRAEGHPEASKPTPGSVSGRGTAAPQRSEPGARGPPERGPRTHEDPPRAPIAAGGRCRRLHADRAAGGHRHHRRPDRAAAAGRAGGPRGGPAGAVH